MEHGGSVAADGVVQRPYVPPPWRPMMSRNRLLSAISAGLFPADSSQLSKSLIRTLLRGAVPCSRFIVIDGNRRLWRDIPALGPVAPLRNPLAMLPIREKKPLLMV
jgi:hypothetical protein